MVIVHKCRAAITALCIFFLVNNSKAQPTAADSSNPHPTDTTIVALASNEQAYHLKNGQILIYTKPKPFSFITNLPKDAGGIASAPFKKGSLKPLVIVAGSTAVLLLLDQPIANELREFSEDIQLLPHEHYRDIINLQLAGKTPVF